MDVMVLDTYHTIEYPSEGEYKEKGSKFLAFAYPMDNESDLDLHLAELKDIHPKARHFCYAYRLGIDNNRFRTNDDGEPSGTAGKPIYGQIQSYNLTNLCIIVIRYFGGTKLGVSGLIHAYKESAKDALANAVIIEKHLFAQYHLGFGYEEMGHILNVLKELDIPILEKRFDAECSVIIKIRLSLETHTLHRMKAKMLQKSMEEVDQDAIIDFCKVSKI